MNWIFSKSDGGMEYGINDAGVETFKGNFDRYLARESIQNSIDARNDASKPVIVVFEKHEFKRDDLPQLDQLVATLGKCADYWKSNKKAKEFFDGAKAMALSPKITTLRVGDYNTTGVLGSDTDRDKNWYSLIRCSGSSSKLQGEGGSFGIGKNAPFAASKLRTVLYSTKNTDGEVIFQGVSKLATHSSEAGTVASHIGFLGGRQCESVRVAEMIPKKFLRQELGTDIYVLGFQAFPTWEADLIYSVLENFWPAIESAVLEVRVGDKFIRKDNLKALLEEYSAKEGFTAHHYYAAFKSPSHPVNETLPQLKDVRVCLLNGDPTLPKKVAMVRKTGMVIYHKRFNCVMPYCGVFLCQNDAGNMLLREMEPPRHDVWDPDHPEKGANKRIEKEFGDFIRKSIKEMAPVDNSKTVTIPDLNRYLPDDDQSPEESTSGGAPSDKMAESLKKVPPTQKIEPRKIESIKNPMQPNQTMPGSGESETEISGEDDFDEPIPTRPPEPNPDPTPKNDPATPPEIEPAPLSKKKGAPGGSGSKPAIPVQFRTFAKNADGGVYVISVQPASKTKKELLLGVYGIGDDSKKTPLPVRSAKIIGGAAVAVQKGLMGPLIFQNNVPIRLEVELNVPIRAALEIAAHEA